MINGSEPATEVKATDNVLEKRIDDLETRIELLEERNAIESGEI